MMFLWVVSLFPSETVSGIWWEMSYNILWQEYIQTIVKHDET